MFLEKKNSPQIGYNFLFVFSWLLLQYFNDLVPWDFLWSVFLSLAFVEIDVELCSGCWDEPPRIPFTNNKLFPEVLAYDCSQLNFSLEMALSLWQLPCPGRQCLLIPARSLNQTTGWCTGRGSVTVPQFRTSVEGHFSFRVRDPNGTSVESSYQFNLSLRVILHPSFLTGLVSESAPN